LAEDVVDIDAYEDADLPHPFQFLTQFEVTAGTKIANHGMEDVEVGHFRGEAVEFVHQRRPNIVEELGAHDVSRLALRLSETSQKRSVNFCLDLRFAKTLTTNKKAHGFTVSILLSCVVNNEIWRFQVHLKSKNALYQYVI
jgi:hypothetical protein